ncbi:unnamed protein product [Parnassius mnemosyne]|uniref:Reverse transcriptase RNase H-like domain-containing protein n=1 Tax=Parnassius mnemosyne TaxID=213953 RepID=A0AAV1KF98_9NEOP
MPYPTLLCVPQTLAVVRAFKYFRHFLYGRKFKLITDCNALRASKHKQDLLPRIHRWWSYLENFEFDIEYRKGERVQHADFLSRNPLSLNVNVMTRNLEWLNFEQRQDSQLHLVIDSLHNGVVVPGYLLESYVLKRERSDPILGVQKFDCSTKVLSVESNKHIPHCPQAPRMGENSS